MDGADVPVVTAAKNIPLRAILPQSSLKMTQASLTGAKIVDRGGILGIEGCRFAVEPRIFFFIDLAVASENVGEPDIAPGVIRGRAGGNHVAEDRNRFHVTAVACQIDGVAIGLRQIEDAFGRLAQLAFETAFRSFDSDVFVFAMDSNDNVVLVAPHRAADMALMTQPAAQETI